MASNSKAPVDTADDLDDLDDILDEFSEEAKPQVQPAQTSAKDAQAGALEAAGLASSSSQGPGLLSQEFATREPGDDATGEGAEFDEENERFAQEMAQGLEALMKGMNPEALAAAAAQAGPSGAEGAADGQNPEALMNEEEMMKQFEQMMMDMGLGGPSGAMPGLQGSASTGAGAKAAGTSAGASTSAPQQPVNFQDAIKNTMSRLRESDQSATSNASQGGEMDFEKLMAAFGNTEGIDGEQGMANMLESMMNELMSKEVLYDPIKELRDKYPGYLRENASKITPEDRLRYENQQRIVTEVIKTFDDSKFDNGSTEEKATLKAKVQTLMNEMQDNGAPPQEIIGDLPPELEGMPGLGQGDENCTIA